jgi:hypothetical protein
MYARVLADGIVRAGDPIRVLPPADGSEAGLHQLLDLLESVEREAWLSLWRAAESAGIDIRIVDRGDLTMAACPSLPGSTFNRTFGIRQVPIALPEVRELYRDTGTTGWIVAGAGDPPWPGAIGEEPTGVHATEIDTALGRAASVALRPGLAIRAVDPGDAEEVDRWRELVVRGFGLQGPEAETMARTNRLLIGARGEHAWIASLDGIDVAAAAAFLRGFFPAMSGRIIPPSRCQFKDARPACGRGTPSGGP